MVVFIVCILADFPSASSALLSVWDTAFMCFSFQSCQFLLHVFGALLLGAHKPKILLISC